MASYPEYKGIVDFAQAIDDTYVRKDAPSVPVGGAKGEVLRKKSSTDGDAEWADPMYHFETLAQMQTALSQGQIPDGANIVVEEEQPGGNTGDTSLDTTSENWVQNKVVATAISNLNSELTNKTGRLNFANSSAIALDGSFTPSEDGVAFIYAVSATAGRTYIYLFDVTLDRIIGISDITATAGNSVVAFSTPVGKNRSYSIGSMNAINGASIFVPYA